MNSLDLHRTPGPWHYKGTQIIGKLGRRTQYVADACRDVGFQTSIGNARLLALAPELLEAVALAANQAATLASRCSDPEERARFQADEAHFRALVFRAS